MAWQGHPLFTNEELSPNTTEPSQTYAFTGDQLASPREQVAREKLGSSKLAMTSTGGSVVPQSHGLQGVHHDQWTITEPKASTYIQTKNEGATTYESNSEKRDSQDHEDAPPTNVTAEHQKKYCHPVETLFTKRRTGRRSTSNSTAGETQYSTKFQEVDVHQEVENLDRVLVQASVETPQPHVNDEVEGENESFEDPAATEKDQHVLEEVDFLPGNLETDLSSTRKSAESIECEVGPVEAECISDRSVHIKRNKSEEKWGTVSSMKPKNAAQPDKGQCDEDVQKRVSPNTLDSKAITFNRRRSKEPGENHHPSNDAADAHKRQTENDEKRGERIRD
ncbi:MAG: hypothetical protein Q9213_007796 [Squamulea squamosa]